MGSVVAIRHVAALKLVSAVAAAGVLAACAEPEAEPLAPQFEPGPATPIDIAVSDKAACLLLGDGRLVSWGRTTGGAVNPDSSYVDLLPPTIVPTIQHVVTILPNAGSFCALTFEGQPYCWGDGFFGQLGDGFGDSHWAPWPVYGETFTEMWAGNAIGCGVRPPPGEELVCWGIAIGDGTMDATAIPTVMDGFPRFHIMSPPCLVDLDGTLWCWGSNSDGALGDPAAEARWTPGIVEGIPKVRQVARGNPACAVTQADEVWCWGDNAEGGAGLGYASPVPEPVHRVPALSNAVGVASGWQFACSWLGDGTLWCWGENNYGSLADGTDDDRPSPVQVPLIGVKKAATRIAAVCAILEDDSVWCWGDGDGGILNRGSSREDSLVPIEIDWRSALEAAE